MEVIAGLGNPGRKYEQTRHNAGFMVVDELAQKYGIKIDKKEFDGLTGSGTIAGKKVLLVKPQTYMNLSGECIGPLLKFYKIPVQQLIVIYDDIDISLEKIRVRAKGHAGSHNGMRNITEALQDTNFIRVRVGTDKPPEEMELADYVLQKLTKEEMQKMKRGVTKASAAVEEILSQGCESAMNLYNGEL